jgi:HEPN domain-containing protein
MSKERSVPLWLVHARSDLRLAEMPPPDGVLLENLCFHAQQAAEKAIKAVILHQTNELAPRSHDIQLLLRVASAAGAELPVELGRAAGDLTEYAVISRYPADLGEVSQDELRQAVAVASGVVRWAERVVGEGQA